MRKEIKKDIVLFVGTNVVKVDRDKKQITLSLIYPNYLTESNKKADELIDRLIEQLTNYFSHTPIRGMELRYQQVDIED